MARPLKEIDWATVEKLCSLQCTGEEIASFLDISYDTLERAVKREKKQCFADYYNKKRGTGKISLRRKQYEVAMAGNPTMLIWLGKQWLGQAEKIVDETESEQAVPTEIVFTVADARIKHPAD